MKQLIIVFIIVSHLSLAQTFRWLNQSGPISKTDLPNSIVSDSAGNSFVGGSFQSVLSIEQSTFATNGSNGAFVAKFDSKGALAWVFTGISSSSVYFSELAIDEFSNIYFVATTDASVMTVGSTTISSGAKQNFLCCLSANGTLKLIKDFVKGPLAYRAGLQYMNGSLYMHSSFGAMGTVVIGSNSFTPKGGTDFLVAKFDTLGNPKWSNAFGGSLSEEASGIAVNSANEVFVCGLMQSKTVVMGDLTLSGQGNYNTTGTTYLAKFNNNGILLWAKTNKLGNIGRSKLATDRWGRIYFAGYFSGTIQMDSEALTSSGQDVFLFALNGNGDPIWKLQTQSSFVANLNDLKCDQNGNTFFCGMSAGGSLTFGTFSVQNSAGTTANSFVAAVDNRGKPVCLLSSGGNGESHAYAITNDQKGSLYVSGIFSGPTSSGPLGIQSGTTTIGPYSLIATKNTYNFYVTKVSDISIRPAYLIEGEDNTMDEIFPIPASDLIYVACKSSSILSTELWDMAGKLIMRNSGLDTAVISIDISNYAAGIYLLNIETTQGVLRRKVIVE